MTTVPTIEQSAASLEGLIAWLEKKDPSAEYQWCGKEPCLIEQYCSSLGMTKHDVYSVKDENGKNIYDRLVSPHSLAAATPHTFGAALERARVALAS